MPLLGGGCDAGTQTNASLEIGPPLQVVGFNGSGGQVPTDGTIQIAFNRLLAPSSVTRQSFVLYDSLQHFPEPVVTYDPVARVVSLSNPGTVPAWLTPGSTYTLSIGVAAAGDYTGGSGPRAIDEATLTAPVVETFQAVSPATPTPSPDRPMSFCADVLPIFQLRCSAGECHGAPVGTVAPAEGLILETPLGIANTAIGRVSQESNTGGIAGEPQAQGEQFGVDMAIVGTGNPGASWLMYKVLLGQWQLRPIDESVDAGVATCGDASAPTSVLGLPSPQPTLTPPATEVEILKQYILGNQMPYPINFASNEQTPAEDFATLPLTFDELERVRAWIAQGASTEACNACPSSQ